MNVKLSKRNDKKSKNAGTQKTLCYNPGTGEKLAEYPVNTTEDVRIAVKKARSAQVTWAAMPIKKRVKHMLKIRAHIISNIDRISEIISRDNGKTRADALIAEVVPSTMAISFYCRKAASFLKDRKLPLGNIAFINKRSRVARVPFGVVGII